MKNNKNFLIHVMNVKAIDTSIGLTRNTKCCYFFNFFRYLYRSNKCCSTSIEVNTFLSDFPISVVSWNICFETNFVVLLQILINSGLAVLPSIYLKSVGNFSQLKKELLNIVGSVGLYVPRATPNFPTIKADGCDN